MALDITNEVCRYRGCGDTPQLTLVWVNPALPHKKPKYWPVCTKHRPAMEEYLASREVIPQVLPFPAQLPLKPGPGEGRAHGGSHE